MTRDESQVILQVNMRKMLNEGHHSGFAVECIKGNGFQSFDVHELQIPKLFEKISFNMSDATKLYSCYQGISEVENRLESHHI